MVRTFRIIVVVGVFIALLGLSGKPAQSAESGTGVYLLGYQSSMAGYLPAPGVYLRNDFYWYQGNAKALPFSGRVEANLREPPVPGSCQPDLCDPLEIPGNHLRRRHDLGGLRQ